MIQVLSQLPNNVVGFRASGEVTKEDFYNVLVPEVERLISAIGEINFLLLLDTSVKNFTAGAWLQDAMLGIKNITKWNRAAIVSDSEAISKFTELFSKVIPGEFKGFSKEEMDDAIAWTTGPLGVEE